MKNIVITRKLNPGQGSCSFADILNDGQDLGPITNSEFLVVKNVSFAHTNKTQATRGLANFGCGVVAFGQMAEDQTMRPAPWAQKIKFNGGYDFELIENNKPVPNCRVKSAKLMFFTLDGIFAEGITWHDFRE